MIIARGRAEGWLKLPVSALPPWGELNDVTFNGISVGLLPGFEQRGSTVIAARDLSAGDAEPLMIIPRDLVLSQEAVRVHAKSDQHLRQVLDALAEFGRVSYLNVFVCFFTALRHSPFYRSSDRLHVGFLLTYRDSGYSSRCKITSRKMSSDRMDLLSPA